METKCCESPANAPLVPGLGGGQGFILTDALTTRYGPKLYIDSLVQQDRHIKWNVKFYLMRVNTCSFGCHFQCGFSPSGRCERAINSKCSECMILHLDISNRSARSHTPKGENRSKKGILW